MRVWMHRLWMIVFAMTAAVWAELPAVGQIATQPASQPVPIPPASELLDWVHAFETDNLGVVGLSIVDCRSGRTLVSHRATETFIPASNQKLLTSAFALSRLGADFHFTTTVCAINKGDDVMVFGDFDPTLGDPALAKQNHTTIYAEPDRWAKAVREKIGPAIRGNLIFSSRNEVNSSLYPPDWAERHLPKWYGAPVSCFNFHDNCYDVTFLRQGDAILPQVTPQSDFIRVENRTTLGRKHSWGLRSAKDESTVTVWGTIQAASGDPISVPCNSPMLLLARVFLDRLARADVKATNPLKFTSDPKGVDSQESPQVLAQTKTPLSTVLTRANRNSLNMAAECMMLRAGDGTWTGSAKLMQKTLVETFGLDAATLVIRDGSGLSDTNRVTPTDITRLLIAMRTHTGGKVFFDSLARTGQEGTLRRRLKQGPYLGQIAAKSGYLSGVVCLSGYVLDEDDRPAYAFSILINKVRGVGKAKALEDRICAALIDSLVKPAE